MEIESKIVATKGVLKMCGVSHAHFYRVVLKLPDFPRPFKLGLRKNAWLKADVEAWINSRAALANALQPKKIEII